VYVSLGPRRGGLLHNLSEGGLAVEVRGIPLSGQVVPVAFDLQENKSCIETISQIAWRDKLGRRAGLEFLDLPEICQQQIKEWLSQRTFVGKHQGMVTQPGVSETDQFGSLPTQHDLRRQDTPSEAADLMLVEQPHDSPSATYEHLTDLRSAVIQPRRTRETKLREEKAAVEKEGRGGKSWEIILEARHAPGLFAGIVGLFGLMFILGYFLGRGQPYPQTSAITPVDKETVYPAEASSPPAKARPGACLAESSFEAPLIPRGTIVLQVAALTRDTEAEALAEALRKKEFPAFVLMPSADQYYRVQVGPYADTKSAHMVRRRLEKEGFKPIIKR